MTRHGLMLALIGLFLMISAGGALAGQDASVQPTAVQDDVQKLTKDVQSKSAATRMAAARKLGALGAQAAPAVPYLIEMLADTQRFYWDGVVDGRMTGGSKSGGEVAADALVLIGEPSALPLVSALGSHPKSLVRWGAAGALGRLNDGRAVEPLLRALADKDWDVGQAAAWALGRLKADGIKDILHARLSDPSPAVAEGVLSALAQQGDMRVLSFLTDRLKGTALDARERALTQLGWLRSPEALDAILGVVSDPETKIRRAAAKALGEFSGEKAVAALIGLLEDAGPDVRYLAVVSLTRIKDPAAVEPLRKLLARERRSNVRQAAEAAIALMTK